MKNKNVLVKICGITNTEDAVWAANLGADFIGLNFSALSKRKVSLEKAKEITDQLPSFVKVAGVFVDPMLPELEKIIKVVKISIIQLHGNESPEFAKEIKEKFGLELWKAIRLSNENSLNSIQNFCGIADSLMLDTFNETNTGGTGQTFDWDLAIQAKIYNCPLILAGGLNPENVQAAIKKVDPKGVDVASGVEKENHPRKKDIEKLRLFIQKAKGLL